MATLQDRLDAELRQRNQFMSDRQAQQEALFASAPKVQAPQGGLLQQAGDAVRGPFQAAGNILFPPAQALAGTTLQAGKEALALGQAAGPEILQGGRNYAAGLLGRETPVDNTGSFLDNASSNLQSFNGGTPASADGVPESLRPRGYEFTAKEDDFSALGFDLEKAKPEQLEQIAADNYQKTKSGDLSDVRGGVVAYNVAKKKAVESSDGNLEQLKVAKPKGMGEKTWDALNSNFDLTAIGMSLLATNGNGQNLAANLGYALQVGKASLDADADRKIALADRQLNNDYKAALIEQARARVKSLAGSGATALLEFDSRALDVLKKQFDIDAAKAKPNVTETSVANQSALQFLGFDSDKELDTDEIAVVKSVSDNYAATTAAIRNIAPKFGISNMSPKVKSALTQMLMDRNNPSAIESFNEDAFLNVDADTQATVSKLLGTRNGADLMAALTSSTLPDLK
tara:strand:- start:4 stop:1377 length:1374 start_codon:yes stop_codon:yes gene_type:complete